MVNPVGSLNVTDDGHARVHPARRLHGKTIGWFVEA